MVVYLGVQVYLTLWFSGTVKACPNLYGLQSKFILLFPFDTLEAVIFIYHNIGKALKVLAVSFLMML